MERQMMRGFAGGFHWILDELSRSVESVDDLEYGEDDSGGGGSSERTFSRVFTFPGGGLGGGGLGGGDGAAAAGRPDGRLRDGRDDSAQRATGVVDGHDWGSAAAARAVKQLQGMGAQVWTYGHRAPFHRAFAPCEGVIHTKIGASVFHWKGGTRSEGVFPHRERLTL
eukprot:349912-Chlamydomonas_euryale.AAC.18